MGCRFAEVSERLPLRAGGVRSSSKTLAEAPQLPQARVAGSCRREGSGSGRCPQLLLPGPPAHREPSGADGAVMGSRSETDLQSSGR